MQTAIILHPDQTLLLIREQKHILRLLNEAGGVYFPVYPLWIFLQDQRLKEIAPKELSNLIKDLKIESAKIVDDKLVFPAKITLTDKTTIYEEIKAAHQKSPICPTPLFSDFSINCNIFKITETTKNGVQVQAWNSKWKKN